MVRAARLAGQHCSLDCLNGGGVKSRTFGDRSRHLALLNVNYKLSGIDMVSVTRPTRMQIY